MSKFKKLNIKNLQKSLIKTFNRFPLSILISWAVFALLVIRIGAEGSHNGMVGDDVDDLLMKTLSVLSLTFFFSISIYLFGESMGATRMRQWIYQLASVVFGGLFYVFFKEGIFETSAYIIVAYVGVLALLFVSPFIVKTFKKKFSQKEFYVFGYRLMLGFIMAIVVGVTSMLLGFVALWAVFELFDPGVLGRGDFWGYWMSFTNGFLAPIFFLVSVPRIESSDIENARNNRFYGFLVKFIGLSAITIYFIILYAYTVKVLANFSEWPQGEVTWMVIGFSLFGYLVYILTYAFQESSVSVRIFRKIFPIAVLPQVAMLFYAIFLRISQYDLTVNRYLVVVFGIWLLGISLYYVISRNKNLSIIFYSIVLTTILISIGSWSIYSLPENRQQLRLIKNLEEANILQDGKIIPLENYNDISKELSNEIYESIEYLSDFHEREALESIFEKEIAKIKEEDRLEFERRKKEQIKEAKNLVDEEKRQKELERIKEREYLEISNWQLRDKLTDLIKVQNQNRYNERERNQKFFNFRLKDSSSRYERAIKVSGYDYYLTDIDEGPGISRFLGVDDVQYKAEVDVDAKKLVILNQVRTEGRIKMEVAEIYDLGNFFDQILVKKETAEKAEHYWQGHYLSEEDLTLELKGEKFDIKILFTELDIPNPEWAEEDQQTQQKTEPRQGQIVEVVEIQQEADVEGEVWIKEKSK